MFDRFTALEQRIGVALWNRWFLRQAFTHPSYLNENPDWEFGHNERLEFLGDAVIELVVREELLEAFPDEDEGGLTAITNALVRTEMLATIAQELGLWDFLLLSRGEAKAERAREHILACTFEALVAALYKDLGFAAAQEFLKKWLLPRVSDVLAQGLHRDPKSVLQTEAQAALGLAPTYRVLEESGPAHAPHFVVGAYLGDEFIARSEGDSKREAETNAAASALRRTGWGKRGEEVQKLLKSFRELDHLSMLARHRAAKRQESP